MFKENISHEFRLKRTYFLKEIEQKELVSKKHKKVCKTLNYIEQILILVSTVTGCFSISAFAPLVVISIGITSSAIRLIICVITVGIPKYKPRKKEKLKGKRIIK